MSEAFAVVHLVLRDRRGQLLRVFAAMVLAQLLLSSRLLRLLML